MTRFHVGDTVKSTTSAQGLEVGTRYRVAAIDIMDTPFGGFVDYLLEPLRGDVGKLWVRNGHLLLEPVEGRHAHVDG